MYAAEAQYLGATKVRATVAEAVDRIRYSARSFSMMCGMCSRPQ